METNRWLFFLLLPLILGGCATEMLQETAPRKGPVAAVGYIVPGGGEIRYSAQGWSLVIAARRRTALYRMRKVCKGMNLKITDEFTHTDEEVPYNGGDLETDSEYGIAHYQLQPYHHIVFQCAPRPALPAKK